MNRGLAAVVAAFLIWGLLPVYLKALGSVPAPQIMAHRLVWCCLTVSAFLALRGRIGLVAAALARSATRWRLLGSGALISGNWLLYVWAVETDHLVEASLGYFINPLINIVLGVLFLQERLSSAQWAAVALAATGVAWIGLATGAPPWIALILALSFGSYGLIRKTVAVEAVPGLAAEMLLIAPLGLAYLLAMEFAGRGAFGHQGAGIDALLMAGGLVTAVPLALFAYGARRIRYATVGLVQYLGPSLQLLLGVFAYGEPFTGTEAIGFTLIWAALALYAGDGLRQTRRTPVVVAEP